eukprot:359194-Chlamydomonas_euryale.AAC.2
MAVCLGAPHRAPPLSVHAPRHPRPPPPAAATACGARSHAQAAAAAATPWAAAAARPRQTRWARMSARAPGRRRRPRARWLLQQC